MTLYLLMFRDVPYTYKLQDSTLHSKNDANVVRKQTLKFLEGHLP